MDIPPRILHTHEANWNYVGSWGASLAGHQKGVYAFTARTSQARLHRCGCVKKNKKSGLDYLLVLHSEQTETKPSQQGR